MQLNDNRSWRSLRFFVRGAGLIEILVSLLVIAIGVLGMVGVHSSSLQYNQSSYVQSQATLLATDMLDRVQANSRIAKSSSHYRVGFDESIYAQCAAASYPDTCESGSCSPEQLAAYDIQQWKFQLACQLPGSKGGISFEDNAGQRTYTIRLNFPDMGDRVPLNDIVLRGVL